MGRDFFGKMGLGFRGLLLILTLVLSGTKVWAGSGESSNVTFSIDTGQSGQKIVLASSLNNWGADKEDRDEFTLNETTPGHYQITLKKPWLFQISYKFIIDGQWTYDPENPNSEWDGHGSYNSVFNTGFQDDPWLRRFSKIPAPKIKNLILTDFLGQRRTITVVIPETYQKPMMALYFHDGNDYLQKAGVSSLLANLSADPNMPALVGVFVPPIDRNNEYGFGQKADAYMEFLTQRLIPNVERMIPGLGGSRQNRLLIGPSMGGLITLETLMKKSEYFANGFAQSSSIWVDDQKILGLIQEGPKMPVRLFMDVGTYESSVMAEGARKAYSIAIKNGMDVVYYEFPSTHDWIAWRNRLQMGIRHFFESP